MGLFDLIKPNELRVGNYVNFKNRIDIDYCEITTVEKSGYIHILRNFKDGNNNDDQPENINDLTPILLTEEWLRKCDFNPKFSDLSVAYGITKQTFDFVIGNYYKRIYYVHELQNLYFALTNTELIWNGEK